MAVVWTFRCIDGEPSSRNGVWVPRVSSESAELRLGEASAKVHDIVETAAFESASAKITALTLLAIDENLPVARQFAEVTAKFAERDIYRIPQRTEPIEFIFITDIEEELTVSFPLLGRNGCDVAAYDVVGHKPCD